MARLDRLMTRNLRLILSLVLFSIVVLLYGSSNASAIIGASTNVFPDTSIPAGSTTYSVVQLATGGAQVKARTTVANVYVPVSMAGANIQLVVVNGCNNSGPDINGWAANTAFYMDYPATGTTRTTASHCAGGNITLDFTAITTHLNDPDPTRRSNPVRQVSDSTGTYYVYRYKADAYGTETTQYLNAFQVWGVTAGIFLGPSDMPSDCDITSYPRSCPSRRPDTGQSLVYSSYYNRTNPYGQRIQVRTGPCVSNGKISLYDLDANDSGLRQNLSMEIRENGVTIRTLTHAEISGWELYTAPDGSMPHLGLYGGNEDQYMDLPTVGTFTMRPNTDYELIINGISFNNALQAAILTYDEGSSCGPIIRGCTDSGAINYNPLATVNDGSCDICANISGAQGSLPAGLIKDGNNCVFPAPTCTPAAAITAFTGQLFTMGINLRNNSTSTLDVVSIRYAGPSGLNGITNGGSLDVGPSPASIDQSASDTRNNPVSDTITWTIEYGQTASIPVNGIITCTQPISIRHRPPVCRVLDIDPLVPQVGEPFKTRVRITNPNPVAINLTSADYELQSIPSDSRNTNTSGSATVSFPQVLPTGIAGVEYESAQNIRVYRQALDFDVLWTIVAEDADAGECTRGANDESLFDIPLLPPICTVTQRSVVVGVPFIISVSVTNQNTFVSIQLRNTGQEYALSNGRSGEADPDGGWDPASGFTEATMDRVISFNSVEDDLTVDSSGGYRVNWTIDSEAGIAGGDCVGLGAPFGGGGGGGVGDCVAESDLCAETRPYVRFYGNDVFAGGSYGASCTFTGDPQARGYGFFSGGAPSHTTYRGAASELAVFALGQIDGVLPGSQDIARPSLQSLSFSNTSPGTGTNPLGGNFASPLCADNYWDYRPNDMDTPALLPAAGTTLPRIDLSSLASGDYEYDGDVHVYASSPIVDGRRISLYIEGNTWIGDTSYVGASTNSISYDRSDAWLTIDEIPLVRLITKGNMYIDNNMDSLDGAYIAMPNEDPSVAQPTGEIHTCALGETLTKLGDPTGTSITQYCGQKLTVNGAFIAKRVHLLRINGNIGNALAAPENYDSANIAESFRFSPELYLALISAGQGKNTGQFDSIKSLPPAL